MTHRENKKNGRWSETFTNNGQCPRIPQSDIEKGGKISFPIFFCSTFDLFSPKFWVFLGLLYFFLKRLLCLFLLTLIKILGVHILFRLAVCIKHKDIGVGSTGEFGP